MVPPPSHKVSRVSWYSGYRSSKLAFPYGAFTLSGGSFQNPSGSSLLLNAVHTPWCTHHGLGSSAFARRYLRNHCYFLFLCLLRCFSSAGSRLHTMDSCTVAAGLLQQVSPFRNPRITGYLLLPAAYRSLSRLSSALSAKASTLRSFCLTASCPLAYGHAVGHVLVLRMSSCLHTFRRARVSLWIQACNLYSPRMSRYSNQIRMFCSVCGFQGTNYVPG